MKFWKSYRFLLLVHSFSLTALLFFVTCSVGAVMAYTPQDEIEIGKNYDKEIVKNIGLLPNKKIQEYVSSLGQSLVKKIQNPIFEYHFKVLDMSDVNAFALPGGYIYVTRGMLSYISSEAELSSVLGHEIGHVTSHHSMKQIKKSLGSTLLTIVGLLASNEVRKEAGAWVIATTTLSQHMISGYGREAEMQSDQLGIVYSYNAGYDPRVVTDFFRKLKAMERFGGRGYHGFLASHPDTIERIISTEGKSNSIIKTNDKLKIKRDEYLAIIDGLPYGKGEGELKKKKKDYYIKVYEVKKKGKLKKIVTSVSNDPSMALETALINGLRVSSILKPDDKIKIIMKNKDKRSANNEPIQIQNSNL